MNYLDIIAPAITIIAVACYISQIITRLERKLATVTAQRDSLAEALRVATAYPLSESWYKQAIEALATLKP
jgi:hypothetical protein